MAKLRYIVFRCVDNGHEDERLVEIDESYEPVAEERCSWTFIEEDGCVDDECESLMRPLSVFEAGQAPLAQVIVEGNSDFSERQRARLEVRSSDHWKRKGRDEARDRESTYNRKHGIS